MELRERSRCSRVLRPQMRSKRRVEKEEFLVVERPSPEKESWVTAASEEDWGEQVTLSHEQGSGFVVFHSELDPVKELRVLERFLMISTWV